MAPQLQVLSNVIQRIKNINTTEIGRLYGVFFNDTLTVLTFGLSVADDSEFTINSVDLQLNMPAEIDFCGVLHIGQNDNKTLDALKEVDITDNPLLLKYSVDQLRLEAYFYVHQKLELVSNFKIITEEDMSHQFTYVRLQGSLPLSTCNANIIDAFKEPRKNIASGKVGIHFPSTNRYLFDNDDHVKDISFSEMCTPEPHEGFVNIKNDTSTAGHMNPIHATMFIKLSEDKHADTCIKSAPILQYMKRTFDSLECFLNIDALSLVCKNASSTEVYAILVESVCHNINLIEKCLEEQVKMTGVPEKLPRPLHFNPKGCGHFLTLIYPVHTTDNDTTEYRKAIHKVLALGMTRPFFRRGNAVQFSNSCEADNVLLINPHESLIKRQGNKETKKISLVDGSYSYHHYMQENFDDSGWGCAYRSLQTIISWYRLQGYTDIPVPSHRAIQKCLVDIGDKPSSFIGSKQWIGSIEVGFVLESLLGISTKVLSVKSGEKMVTQAEALADHFKTQGTPIMIGGGVLAHTILGVSIDEVTGEVTFLILDPHYTGTDNLNTVISKGWCGWKTNNFWKKDSFYNMCLPQRPVCI